VWEHDLRAVGSCSNPRMRPNWMERGSPRWLTDGEEDDDGEAIVGSADERWPECDIGSVRRRRRRGSSRYSWLGQRSMGNSDRR
jgi:hypothetical protein